MSETRPEDEISRRLNRCLSDTLLKAACGFGVGVIASVLFIKKKSWPAVLGTGFGLGMGYSNCNTDLRQPFSIVSAKIVGKSYHDWVGPPDPKSNLRKFRYEVPSDETSKERELREKRIATQEWCQQYWAAHNENFLLEKRQFIHEKKSTKCKSENEDLTAEEMVEFYKAFLDKNYDKHVKFNRIMYNSALLLIGEAVTNARLLRLFEFVKNHAKRRVYVSIHPSLTSSLDDCVHYINKCYNTAEKLSSSSDDNIDVRLLLPCDSSSSSWNKTRQADLLVVDSFVSDDEAVRTRAAQFLKIVPSVLLHANVGIDTEETDVRRKYDCPPTPYNYVALGGTFDRLHNGHKILLSVGALFSNQMITVGMTTEQMLASKTLCELIEPLDLRTQNVIEFLNDIKPGLNYHVCPLEDPWGPPAHDPRYQGLVGSPETRKGCEKINHLREEKGFSKCEIHMIDIVNDDNRNASYEEEKVSSSSIRRRILGTLRRPPYRPYNAKCEPYIVGLTGGIASGKSSAGKKLVSLGAHHVDCDLLGHEAYKPGTTCHKRIIETFGQEVVNEETQEINRRVLGGIVFGNESKMKMLTSIVWPEIRHLVQLRIDDIWSKTKDSDEPCVIVVEAAILLDAGWQSTYHEVWATFVPREEAITRLMNRNNLSREESIKRLDSQKSNDHYLRASNVVFCTLWDYEYTFEQIKKAWNLLHKRMHSDDSAKL